MDKICSGCGHEAAEGELFTITVDTNMEWWKTLSDLPQYCDKCKNQKLNYKQQEVPNG